MRGLRWDWDRAFTDLVDSAPTSDELLETQILFNLSQAYQAAFDDPLEVPATKCAACGGHEIKDSRCVWCRNPS